MSRNLNKRKQLKKFLILKEMNSKKANAIKNFIVLNFKTFNLLELLEI